MANAITQPRTGNTIRSRKVANRRSELRLRLLELAAQLFVERGINKVSVEELLDVAGISRATFYGFFASKTELAANVLLPVFDAGIAALATAQPRAPRAIAERLVDLYLQLWREYQHALLLTGQVDSNVYPHIRAQHNLFGEAMQAALAKIAAAGLLRNGSVELSYLVLARTGIPLLRLYSQHPDFERVYRESMLALLLRD
jgi:AcrR family transcriptional regulator